MNEKDKVLMSAKLDDNLNVQYTTTSTGGTMYRAFDSSNNTTAFGYWRDWYYPEVIKYSYPVYLQEQARDKGKQAFEIIKALKDKKLVKLEKVSDFIDLMDELIKIL